MSRVLLLIKGLGRGGAEHLVLSASRHLDTARFEYEVAYLLPWKDALAAAVESAGLPVHCLDGGRGLGWVPRLRRLVRGRRIDLVHAHSPFPAVGARLAVRRTSRIVYTEHNLWPRYHPATYWANLLTFSRNDHVFAVSEEVRASMRYPRGLGARRMPPVETLYHGLDWASLPRPASTSGVRERLGLPPGAPLVGTVGNLTPKKDQATLLRAVALLRREVPDVRLAVVGQGPLQQELHGRCRDLGLEDAVVFTGYRDDATTLMGAFDVFALSSVYEGLSIALLEAMALARPVVVTRVGGNPEVVRDGREGVLVPPGDPRRMAEALGSLLLDRDLRRRLGEAAHRRAAGFDIRAAVRRMEEVYGELLG